MVGASNPILVRVQTASLAVGQTVSVAPNIDVCYIDASAGAVLASCNVYFPSLPATGQVLRVCTNKALTSVSLINGTFTNAIGALAAGGSAQYTYIGANWVRTG
jgi:hypothetical protein